MSECEARLGEPDVRMVSEAAALPGRTRHRAVLADWESAFPRSWVPETERRRENRDL